MDYQQQLECVLMSTLAVISDDSDNEILYIAASGSAPGLQMPSVLRFRSKFSSVTNSLSDFEFLGAFRMSRASFSLLLSYLRPHIFRNEQKAKCSSTGAIQPAVRLGVTLRMLAGGSYLDQTVCWGIGHSMTFEEFQKTIQAIGTVLQMPGMPLSNEEALKTLANWFQESRNRPNPLYGCVSALDGIAILKTPDEYVPRNFYCRKGMYPLPVQAVVDSRIRFRYMSCRCTGSTHDAAAFDASELANQLRRNEMKSGVWIPGDAAYVRVAGLLTPWPKTALVGESGIFAGSFNFYHSSHRIHVEQAFGVFVRRWGLFWISVQYHINDILNNVSAAMRLHKFCIDSDAILSLNQQRALFDNEMEQEAFRSWWRSVSSLR